MDDDEKQLDSFLLNARDAEEKSDAPKQSDEDVVEQKAREGGKRGATILQNRSVLSDAQLEKNIAASLRKFPMKLDEPLFRQQIAKHFESNDDINEAQYQQLLDKHLAKSEQEQEQETQQDQPLLSSPAFLSPTLDAAKNQATRVSDWANTLPTPGGVGLMIFVLLFFIWVIVPVSNGRTRLQLLWGVLTNQVIFNGQSRAYEQKAAIPAGYTGEILIPPDEQPYFKNSSVTSNVSFNPTQVTFENL